MARYFLGRPALPWLSHLLSPAEINPIKLLACACLAFALQVMLSVVLALEVLLSGVNEAYPSIHQRASLSGLTLPLRLNLRAVRAFCISMVIALSTLPDDSFL